MVGFFTTPGSDFELRSSFASFFSNIAEIRFFPFVLLSVWGFLRQRAFPVKVMSLCENGKTFGLEFCVSMWDSVAPKPLYSLSHHLFQYSEQFPLCSSESAAHQFMRGYPIIRSFPLLSINTMQKSLFCETFQGCLLS